MGRRFNRKARLPGLLVPTQGSLSILAPQAGVLMELPIHEGQTVKAGDVLKLLMLQVATVARLPRPGKFFTDGTGRRQAALGPAPPFDSPTERAFGVFNPHVRDVSEPRQLKDVAMVPISQGHFIPSHKARATFVSHPTDHHSLPTADQPTAVYPRASNDGKSVLTERLRPELIRPSKWGIRQFSTSIDPEFAGLHQSIAKNKGNLVPIKVRRSALIDGAVRADMATYELVYGHRRHRCCLDLHLPVLAIIEEIDDVTSVREMLAENEFHKPLSAWELGSIFSSLLKLKLFKNPRRLALGLRRDPGDVSRALTIFRLPKEVQKAIESPTQLALHDADHLGKALATDRNRTITLAKDIIKTTGPLPARDVVKRLSVVPQSVGVSKTSKPDDLLAGGEKVGQWFQAPDGKLTIKLHFSLTTAQQVRLRKVLVGFSDANTHRDAPPRTAPSA